MEAETAAILKRRCLVIRLLPVVPLVFEYTTQARALGRYFAGESTKYREISCVGDLPAWLMAGQFRGWAAKGQIGRVEVGAEQDLVPMIAYGGVYSPG